MFTGPDGRRKAVTMAVTCLGFFMVLLDVSIVTVALPTIQASLKASLSDLQWVVDGYTLPFAVLLLTAGTLGDRFGRKRLFLSGLVIFSLGSALCGLAPDLHWLIAGRALQGAGGAALAPGSLSLLVGAFSDPRERIRALGLWSGISGIAIAAGSIVGGALVQLAGWPAIFLVNLPIGGLTLLLGLFGLRESRDPAARRADFAGQALAIAGLFALTFALIEGNGLGWGSPEVIGLLVTATALLGIFLVVEKRSIEPMLPLSLFSQGIFSAANASIFLVGFSLLGTVFFSAQYFQVIQGMRALDSGIRSLPITMGLFVAAPFSGRIAARFGFRPPILTGSLMAAAGLLLMTAIEPATPYGELWWKLALVGLGFGIMVSPLTSSVMTSTPPSRAGLASSVVNTSRQVGAVFGIAVLGAAVQRLFSANLIARLEMAGLSHGPAAELAGRLSGAGSQAVQLALPGLDSGASRLLVAGAFTDALHVAYLVAGLSMLVVSFLSATVFGERIALAPAQAPEEVLERAA